MSSPSVIHNTFTIERAYPAAPDRVFTAFADPSQKRRWFVEGGDNQVERYELDFRVGGKEIASFRHGPPVQGWVFTADAVYLDIRPNRRIVFASTMAMGEARISATLVTVEFLAAGNGTTLLLTHQGVFFEGADGPQMREEGWRKLLDRLATHDATQPA
jgi:uncharacterized protein YndB with AHSA1/START domain